MKNLTEQEKNLALNKIRAKYEKLAKDFNKSRAICDAFEERYIHALKNKMDLSVFLLAEIEAVEELYNKEKEKREAEIAKNQLLEKTEDKKSFADKIYEDNKKRIAKYPRISLSQDADEDLERLLGGIRELLNNYFPIVISIFKDQSFTAASDKINSIYERLVRNYSYSGDFPIAKHYISSLERKPRDLKRIDYEHRIIMQESAFLLNEILDFLTHIKEKKIIPNPEKKVLLQKKILNSNNLSDEIFKGKNNSEAIDIIHKYVNNMVEDFRFKGIKKNYLK